MKPIDKTKKANRRCGNCEHFVSCPQSPDHDDMEGYIRYGRIPHQKVCPTAGDKPINYWNCCKHFQWASSKTYA